MKMESTDAEFTGTENSAAENDDNENVKHANYKCEYCSITFRKHAKYIRHLRTHTKERPFACTFPDCGKTFSRKEHLTRHMASHNEVYSFPCTYEGCKKTFKSEYNLKRHLKKHLQKEVESTQIYKCQYCTQEFQKKNQLRKHEYLHTGVKPFVCNFPGCFQSFFSAARLSYHEKIHSSTSVFACSIMDCKYVTSSKEEYEKHLKEFHHVIKKTEIKTVERILCTVEGCKQTFSSKKSLYSHIQSFHEHITFKCETCGKEYAQLSSLSRHRRTHLIAESERKRKNVLLAIEGRKRSLSPKDVDEVSSKELKVNETSVKELKVSEMPVKELKVSEAPVKELNVEEIPSKELNLTKIPTKEFNPEQYLPKLGESLPTCITGKTQQAPFSSNRREQTQFRNGDSDEEDSFEMDGLLTETESDIEMSFSDSYVC